jgi:hypothetical protein
VVVVVVVVVVVLSSSPSFLLFNLLFPIFLVSPLSVTLQKSASSCAELHLTNWQTLSVARRKSASGIECRFSTRLHPIAPKTFSGAWPRLATTFVASRCNKVTILLAKHASAELGNFVFTRPAIEPSPDDVANRAICCDFLKEKCVSFEWKP